MRASNHTVRPTSADLIQSECRSLRASEVANSRIPDRDVFAVPNSGQFAPLDHFVNVARLVAEHVSGFSRGVNSFCLFLWTRPVPILAEGFTHRVENCDQYLLGFNPVLYCRQQ